MDSNAKIVLNILIVLLSKSAASLHVSRMKMKPCGCLESAEIELCFFLPLKAALNLDFVTQLPQGDNGLSKPASPPSLSMGLTFPQLYSNIFEYEKSQLN